MIGKGQASNTPGSGFAHILEGFHFGLWKALKLLEYHAKIYFIIGDRRHYKGGVEMTKEPIRLSRFMKVCLAFLISMLLVASGMFILTQLLESDVSSGGGSGLQGKGSTGCGKKRRMRTITPKLLI